MLHKIPLPIKYLYYVSAVYHFVNSSISRMILSQVTQFGAERGKHYAGVLFVTRFISQAFTNPNKYGLVPGTNKFLPYRVKRNLHIINALLKSVVGVPQPEAALLGLSDIVRDFRDKFDHFLTQVLHSHSMDVGDSTHCFFLYLMMFFSHLLLGFVNETSAKTLFVVHKLIQQNHPNIFKQFKDEIVASGTLVSSCR